MVRTMRFSLPFLAGLVFTVSACVDKTSPKPAEPQVTMTELRAFCPQVEIADETAFYTVYHGGGDDAAKVAYQAIISDVTRNCQYGDGKLVMNIHAAGRVVPGPQFRKGNVIMPVRIRILRGTDEILNKTWHHTVTSGDGMTQQFIFAADGVSIPQPQMRNVRVYLGFDIKKKPAPKSPYED
ncbi:MAG: Putative lipoprotein [Candidatus Tokpelaia hoelldobleri]|uniref:Lipoprotein n=1 Tax=Candidatus Tokpelaia hoelldobleri TaxID=1902579 RepID=A0A1U9JW26_9HYPH|nr:MAG: Putative lipoprotein [Candidatus Tokpelaia hoelldoblerii]